MINKIISANGYKLRRAAVQHRGTERVDLSNTAIRIVDRLDISPDQASTGIYNTPIEPRVNSDNYYNSNWP